MATQNTQRQGGVYADVDLSAKQYHFMIPGSADRAITFAGTAGALAIGVLDNKPVQGQAAALNVGPECKVVCSAAIARGAKISTTNAGQAKTAATGETILGTLLEASPGAGAICAFMFEPGAIAP